MRDAGAGRAGGLLEGGLALVVGYVVSTFHRRRWEEGEWRAVLGTNLSLTLKMGYRRKNRGGDLSSKSGSTLPG